MLYGLGRCNVPLIIQLVFFVTSGGRQHALICLFLFCVTLGDFSCGGKGLIA